MGALASISHARTTCRQLSRMRSSFRSRSFSDRRRAVSESAAANCSILLPSTSNLMRVCSSKQKAESLLQSGLMMLNGRPFFSNELEFTLFAPVGAYNKTKILIPEIIRGPSIPFGLQHYFGRPGSQARFERTIYGAREIQPPVIRAAKHST
jgi:hypothetical protein